ncbi:GNAT family N-acetyltransferase [Ancylobacter dichloromethanicus]|uniref:Acetyltransferase n=1 Tax=Ancylobacter dichloromethanicus TaxID=518825 RepID=A0A9W6MXE1_9HYPH|nr:GNAT family N-acetyltransferase [Ancylobacter dichloromethanicus]MBS7555297.1 GNAT family N-acetyltransferase [Ancylobacter dichloromethanicus]GLK70479.1 acetyltransferase [Ancylobacter dichloromethanicus]
MSEPRATVLTGFDWSRMPDMTDLWVEAWQEALPEIDFEARRGWLCHRIGSLIEEGAAIDLALAEGQDGAPGELLGFVCVHPRTGYVDQLVVHPDHWGAGVASRLVAAAVARSPRHLVLDVNEQNERAVRFYEKAGFAVVGHGVNPTSGRPTLRMERRGGPPRAKA